MHIVSQNPEFVLNNMLLVDDDEMYKSPDG